MGQVGRRGANPVEHDVTRNDDRADDRIVGENMAFGVMIGANAEYPPLASMADGWLAEGNLFPVDSAGALYDPNLPAGHYSQMIWRNSTEVGCGTATLDFTRPDGAIAKRRVLACRYAPAGNMQGETVY